MCAGCLLLLVLLLLLSWLMLLLLLLLLLFTLSLLLPSVASVIWYVYKYSAKERGGGGTSVRGTSCGFPPSVASISALLLGSICTRTRHHAVARRKTSYISECAHAERLE